VLWFEQQVELTRRKRDIFAGAFRGFREFGMPSHQPAMLFNGGPVVSNMPLPQPSPQGLLSSISRTVSGSTLGEQWYLVSARFYL